MKYLLILLITFSSIIGQAQEKTNLESYGINLIIDTKDLAIYKIDTAAKSEIAKKVIIIELEGLKKLNLFMLKQGKKSQDELNKTIAMVKKNKIKIISQEKNSLIIEQKGISQFFYATVIKGDQYFIQSNPCSELMEAKKLLSIAKTIQ
jgi:hypothetical protein